MNNFVLIRNRADGPRDYPLKNGESIYLGAKGSPTSICRIYENEISEALRVAEKKGLIAIEDLEPENIEQEEDEEQEEIE